MGVRERNWVGRLGYGGTFELWRTRYCRIGFCGRLWGHKRPTGWFCCSIWVVLLIIWRLIVVRHGGLRSGTKFGDFCWVLFFFLKMFKNVCPNKWRSSKYQQIRCIILVQWDTVLLQKLLRISRTNFAIGGVIFFENCVDCFVEFL
jgi:hypothetical protein